MTIRHGWRAPRKRLTHEQRDNIQAWLIILAVAIIYALAGLIDPEVG